MKPGMLNRIGAAMALAGIVARAAEPATSPAVAGTSAPLDSGVGPRVEFAGPFFDFGRVQSGPTESLTWVPGFYDVGHRSAGTFF